MMGLRRCQLLLACFVAYTCVNFASAASVLSNLATVGHDLLAEGRALQDAGDYEGARAKFNAHIAAYPSDGNAHHHMAASLLYSGDYVAATTAALIATRLAPQDASYWNTLGETYRLSGFVDCTMLDCVWLATAGWCWAGI